MRSLLAAAAVLALACAGIGAACQTPGPNPGPPADPVGFVYGELVEAGCYAASDSGRDWVARELSGYHDAAVPYWATCMAEGGSVLGCGTPCRPPAH